MAIEIKADRVRFTTPFKAGKIKHIQIIDEVEDKVIFESDTLANTFKYVWENNYEGNEENLYVAIDLEKEGE